MKKRLLLFCLVVITFFSTNIAKSQTDTDFWFVVPEITVNHGYPGGIPAGLVFSTSNLPATITVSMPANPIQFPDIVMNIASNSTYKLDLSSWINTSSTEQNKLENKALNPSGINNFGIHIQSTARITAYYEINNSLNTDIWVLKGSNALGTDFYTPFQTHGANAPYGSPDATALPYSAIDIVATEDNTTIVVTPSKNASYGNAGGAITANTSKTFILNKGQTLSIFPENKSQVAANRLAGSHVTSDKPIAITLKDDSINHPSGGCRDVVGDQLIPVTLTGADHIITRTFLNNFDYIYVVATQNATPIYVDDALVATLNAGQQYQILLPSTNPNGFMKISSRLSFTDTYKPIYVFHVGGFGCEQGGAIIPTIDICTGSTQVAFARSKSSPLYLTIMVKDGAQDGFLVNGEVRNDILPPNAFVLVPGTSWRVARLGSFTTTQLKVGQNFISNTKDIFHLGFINGDPATTCMYGYFSNFNKFKVDALVINTGGPGAMLCNGDSAQLYASGGLNYEWTPTDFLDDPFSNAPIARNLTNSIKYKVLVSGACNLKDSAEVELIVAPYIEANFTVDTITGKAPLTIEITNNSINAYQSLWDFNGDGDMADPGEGLNNSKTFTHTFENNTNEDVINNISLLISDPSSNCFKTAKRSITVSPKFKVDFIIDKYSDCSPSTFYFTNTTSSKAKSFEWDLNNDGTVDFNTKEIPSQLFANTSNNLQVRDIPVKLTATDSTGFTNSIIKTIKTYPNPTASIIIDNNGNTLGCSPLSVNLLSTTTNATIFDWQIDGDSFDNQPNASYTLTNNEIMSVTKSITLNVSNIYGCSASQTANITIQPFIKASFLIDKVESCSPFNLTVLNDSKGSISNFFWDRDGDIATGPSGFEYSSPTSTGWSLPYTNTTVTNTPKNVTIRLKVTNIAGCSDITSNTVTINPPASASFVINNNGNPLGCSPLNLNFESTVINATEFQWFIDGNAFDNQAQSSYTFENFTTSPITKTIAFTASNQYGCTSTQIQNTTIQPYVSAQFIADTQSGCSPLNVNISNTSSAGSTMFQWYFDDVLSATTKNISSQVFANPTVTNIPRLIPVKLVARNLAGCSDQLTKTITVNPQSIPNFTYIDAANPNHCSPFETNFTSNTINTESVQWEFGALGSSDSFNPSFNFSNNGLIDLIVPVQLSTSNSFGCNATKTENIIIRPSVKAQFSLDKTAGCPPFDVTASATLSSSITNYTWSFDGVPYTGPNQTFSNPTNTTGLDITKDIKLTVGSGFCSDEISKSITVYPQVDAKYTASALSGCSPLTVDFASQSELLGTHAPIANIVWDFNDNSMATANPVTHTFVNPDNTTPQSFNVSLTATSSKGCTNTKTIPITVNPAVNAAFNTLITQACTPVRVNVKDISFAGPTISTFTWSYPGGVLLPPEDKDFDIDFDNTDLINAVNRTISLNVTNSFGCTSNKTQTFTIEPQVKANFSISAPIDGQGNPINTLCSPATFNFSNLSTGLDLTYTWDFNDGEILTLHSMSDLEHTFINNSSEEQTYNLQLTARSQNGCTNTSSSNVYIKPTPRVNLGGNQTACEGELITLDAKNPGSTYRWSTNETTRAITISTGGFYSAYVTNTYNCSNFDSVIITFNPKPLLDIGPDTVKTTLPYQISSNISDLTYLWNTGEITPTITVNSYGTYSLYATNSFGCSAFDKMVVMLSTGVEGNNGLDANVRFYPNPAIDELHLTIEAKDPEIYNIELIDQLTRVVKNIKSQSTSLLSTTINTQDLTPGVYLLRVSTKNGTNSYKVIIQK